MNGDKKLPAGMARYIARKVDKAWRVYDKARGSYPYEGAEVGTVQQDTDEKTAQAEAARLNGVETVELPVEEVSNVKEEEDIADYGEMSEEDRAKYEDGLMEKVTY